MEFANLFAIAPFHVDIAAFKYVGYIRLRSANGRAELFLCHPGVQEVLNECFPVHNRKISQLRCFVNSQCDCFLYNNGDTMSTFGERVRTRRKELKIPQEVLAKKVGISQTTISDIERGRNNGSTETAALASALGVNALWLAEEKGPKLVIDGVDPGPNIKGEYPLISWIQAGDWMETIDNFNPGDAENYYACPRKCGPRTFVLRVRGPSMETKYLDGDLIYVDPDVQYHHNSNVIVKIDDANEATFKNLVISGSEMWLRPLNPNWPEKIIPLNEHSRIVGVVIGKFVED